MVDEIKLPKGSVKIGSKKEQFWANVKEMAIQEIANAKNGIEVNEELVKAADAKIVYYAKIGLN